MSGSNLKVLINGGGIAGNAMAFWLSKLGHDITVVEKWPSLRTTGLQLDLRSHGIEVLKRMGLEEAFRAKAAPEEGTQIVDKTGRRRAWFPANKSGKGVQSLTSEYEIMRGDLCRLLHDAALSTNSPPRYTFGTSITSMEQNGASVDVKFDNGETDRFDLVIGADGQWSRTRRLMLESRKSGIPDAFERFAGLFFAYFTINRPIQEKEEYISTVFMVPGNKGIMARRHSPDKMSIMLSVIEGPQSMEDIPRGDVDKEKEAMADLYKGAGWISNEIIKSMWDSEDFYCERLGFVKLDSWSHGHATLVGDAAYCPSVLSGMGTTVAMVGAYILAGEIGRHCGPASSQPGDMTSSDKLPAALRSYEEKFRPFMEHIQKGVEDKGVKASGMGSAWSIALVNFVAGVASFFRINLAAAWGIRETLKGWELPKYSELQRDR